VSFERAVKKTLSWFFEGFVKLLGASAAGVLLAHSQQVRELVDLTFGLTIRSPTAVWTTAAALFLTSSVLVLIACRLSKLKKIQVERTAATETSMRTSKAFTSEDIRSMKMPNPPQDSNDPIDHDACNGRLDKDF
jgi:hypothetical protein